MNLIFGFDMWDWVHYFTHQLKCLPQKTKEQNCARNSLLKTSVPLPPCTAYILGKTTQLLTKHATFYHASITQFL